MVLSAHAKRSRSEEIYNLIDKNPDFDIENLHIKIQEDTFNLCAEKITPQEASEISFLIVPDLSKYSHLIVYSFSKYSSPADLTFSPTFSEKRSEIMLRLVQHPSEDL